MSDVLQETKDLLPEHEVTGYDDRIAVGLNIDIDGTMYRGAMDFYYAPDQRTERLTAQGIKAVVDQYIKVEVAGLRGELKEYE